ncbi:hypothetical protein, partial [Methylobacterium goesingense]|uniref:hypothetical protein n=1 Tax=Methylobacterium goesingense TaxID=243690 RepID=UPI001EE34690
MSADLLEGDLDAPLARERPYDLVWVAFEVGAEQRLWGADQDQAVRYDGQTAVSEAISIARARPIPARHCPSSD